MERQTAERHKRNDGLARIWRAFGYSRAGFAAAYRGEAAFRQELWCVALLAPLALWLGENGVERALLLGSLLAVLVAELLNSAVEAVVDRVSDELHPLSKRAKDIGSAAVLLAILAAALVWLLVLAG